MIATFVGDLQRFQRAGMLGQWLRYFLKFPALWVSFGIMIVAWYAQGSGASPLPWPVVFTLATLVFGYLCIVEVTVRVLSPLVFGQFVTATLTRVDKDVGKRFVVDTFVLSTGAEQRVRIIGVLPFGSTVGQSFVLLRHPSNPSIFLPLFDDNPKFLKWALRFANPERCAEVMGEIERLRAT